MSDVLTPAPKLSEPITMGFIDAIKKIMEGKRVTRISWASEDYCAMNNEFLSIFTKNKMHKWIINDGDMEGEDWIVLSDLN